MLPEFTDKEGKVLTLDEWSLLMKDDVYRRVEETWIDGPHYTYHVSTVWIGIRHQIFETMVFSRGPSDPAGMDQHQARCDNELEAERQHGSVLVRLNQKLGLIQ